MKRFILFWTGIILTSVVLNAQTPLSLSWDGEAIEDTLEVFGSYNDWELIAHAVVTNNTTESIDVKVRRQRLVMVDGTVSAFCWGLCYPPATEESPDPREIGPGESSFDEDFSGHYNPNGSFGTSIVEYEFFDMNDEGINVKMVVKFNATTIGIKDKEEIEISMFPNPATDQLSIESASRIEQIRIFDVNGKSVVSLKPDLNKIQINVDFLEAGFYLVNIKTENGMRTQKLSIR